MKENNNKKHNMSTTHIIMLGFLLAIIVGTILLQLPISTASGKMPSFKDALFTSVSSVCVTGLSVVDTFSYWSTFGQVVILILLQLGGLGIVSFTTGVMLIIGSKVSLKDRLLMQDALNLHTLSGLVRFLQKIFKGTLIVETVGVFIYMTVFVPEYGAKGIWYSIFTSISAFCNAGVDILGNNSLMNYVNNPVINITTMVFIVLGGIGFIVWWDVIRVFKLRIKKEIKTKDIFRKFTLHTKLVLTTTAILIAIGTVLVLIFEYNNPDTLGGMSFPQKFMAALFQSVTVRTGGFFTINQNNIADATAVVCLILMFVGASSVGTGGGIKTTTASVLVLSAIATTKDEDSAKVFNRTIPEKIIKKAMAVTMISLLAVMIGTVLISAICGGNIIDVLYEVVGALSTTGMSRGCTRTLNTAGRIIIMICMYLGRIGPISMAIAFGTKQGSKRRIKYPKEDITVG